MAFWFIYQHFNKIKNNKKGGITMAKGRPHKKYNEYGPHNYSKDNELDRQYKRCIFGCGCWIGPSRSGGPPGLDPFGACPNNPKDGKRQPGNNDYEDVVNGRVAKLEEELAKARNNRAVTFS